MSSTAPPRRKKLVFLLTEDWFFVSHFFSRALAARQAGWQVTLIARQGEAGEKIRAAGIEFCAVDFNRRRLNPLAELVFAVRLARLYRKLRPDVVHHIALKPIVLGGLAARLAGVKNIVNAPVGLGFVFSSGRFLARALKPAVSAALRLTLTPKGAVAIFENPDDRAALAAAGIARAAQTRLIRGAGVDTDFFAPAPEPEGPVRIVLIARMIREKGIGDFVAAARLLAGQAEFLLVGAPDPGNPDSLTEAELNGWADQNLVSWLGPRRDIAEILRNSHIACQPSTYREGLPKSALEAMAAGKPLVATDIPGCREAVVPGETGFLVPPRDPIALAEALKQLIDDPALRARFGAAGRARVERHFSDPLICGETLAVYESLISAGSPP